VKEFPERGYSRVDEAIRAFAFSSAEALA